ncbi:MAG TPA: hypothetical protein VFQ24_16640 [Terriglobia bacterium]|nr:hypothetical protein [Terriglobia bacterium]
MATSNLPDPYIKQNPGDLITAEIWNEMQVDIKKDIAAQIKTAVDNVKSVGHANDADTLGGQTPDQLTKDILTKAEEILPLRTGYFRSFNRLQTGKEKIIKHGLKSFPLADIYQLDYFPAVCSKGDNDATPMWVNFFLYHTSERTITVKATNTKAPIEASDAQPFRVLFADMLALYKVKYADTSTLDELETEFWKAFWGDPNDEFDADQYCHSPWFEKCCGEKRSVKQLKEQGAWDDIWFKMVPRKTINYAPATTDPSQAPTQIQVAHHNFDMVGITLLQNPILQTGFPGTPAGFQPPESFTNQLKIMVLLKV